jgi:hypothetical protein
MPTLLEPPTIVSLKPRPHTLKTGRTVWKIRLGHSERHIPNILHIARILRRFLLDATVTASLALNNQATDRTLALFSSIHVVIFEFLLGPAFVAHDVAAGGVQALFPFVRGARETGDTYLVPADGTNGFDGGIVGRGVAEDVFANVGPETLRCIVQSRSERRVLSCLITSILTIISPGYLVSRTSLLGTVGAGRTRTINRHFVFLLWIPGYLRS